MNSTPLHHNGHGAPEGTVAHCEGADCGRPLAFGGVWHTSRDHGARLLCGDCYLIATAQHERVWINGRLTEARTATLARHRATAAERDPARRARRVRRYVTGDKLAIRRLVALQAAFDTLAEIRTTLAATRQYLADWTADNMDEPPVRHTTRRTPGPSPAAVRTAAAIVERANRANREAA